MFALIERGLKSWTKKDTKRFVIDLVKSTVLLAAIYFVIFFVAEFFKFVMNEEYNVFVVLFVGSLIVSFINRFASMILEKIKEQEMKEHQEYVQSLMKDLK